MDNEGIKELLRLHDFTTIRSMLDQQADADIAELCLDITLVDVIIIFRLLKRDRRAGLFSYLDIDLQEELLEELPEIVISSIINEMEVDDRTKLLEDLSPEIRKKLLLKLSPEQKKIAWQLLNYPDASVGRLMNTDFLAIRKNMTINEALSYIRWRFGQTEKTLEWIFVTDDSGIYQGELNPSTLITTDPLSTKISEIMDVAPQTLTVYDDEVTAVDFFRKYDTTHYPVTDHNGKLVGYITADDVFDVAEEEATEDIQKFGGQADLEESYFKTPIMTLMRKRAGWLSVLFIGELFTGTALKFYDETIAQMSFLIYFVPLVLSSGGNSGSQAASLIIRGMAIREMELSDWKRVFGREILTGLMLGLILGVMGAVRSFTWGYPYYVAIIVFCTLVGVVIFGATIGAMLPFLFKRLNLDPAVSSSPFIASLVDLFGILIFVNVAIATTAFLNVYVLK